MTASPHPVPPDDLRFRARSLALRRAADDRPSTAGRDVLDLHTGRSRRRVAPPGLDVRTVRGRGGVLEVEDRPVVEECRGRVSS